MKVCPKCKAEKTLDEFAISSLRKDGRQGYCRLCRKSIDATRYKNRSKKHSQLVIRRKNERKREISLLIYKFLVDHPCVDCGERDPIVLEFDHVRGIKTNDIATMVGWGMKWENILDEIAKCEVRCANCHRRVTAKRRKQTRYNLSLSMPM